MSEHEELLREIPRLVVDLFEAAGAVRRRGEEVAAGAGQSQARWQVLAIVSEGTWTVPHAARRLGVSRQAVQRVTNGLLRDGLVVADPNPNHKSSPIIRLTDEGRRTLDRILADAGEWRTGLAHELAIEDVAAARRVLRVLASG
jgi:DNA-binding MarR family transcriptional regulator